MDCIWLRMWMYSLILCCGNKFIRSNKNREFTDCDAWGEKKEKWNNISGNSNSNGNGNRIKWLAQPLSHQQNRGCDMVLSFVTLKNVRRTKWMRMETVDEVRMRKKRENMALILWHRLPFLYVYFIVYTQFHFLSRYIWMRVCECVWMFTVHIFCPNERKTKRKRRERESKRKTL